MVRACGVLLAWWALGSTALWAVDHVAFRHDGATRTISGRVELTAQDGGLLLLSRDGTLWRVPAEDLVKREKDETPFAPFTRDELTAQLLAEMPKGFQTHATANYLVCYNTSRAYAQWCGALLERLHAAFTNYWTTRKFELREPEFPLVAMVFADRASYRAYLEQDVGDLAETIIGYYNLRTNRVTMYDLTGIDQLRRAGDSRGTSAQINAMLSRPEAERTVATVIHEATHQLAFNCGLQTRFADVPLWLNEGLAMYFETPDLKSRTGWNTIGAVNRVRLQGFQRYLGDRPAGSLASLLADSKRLRDARLAENAYHESWALTYYLVRRHPEEFLNYLRAMSRKPYLAEDTPEERLKQFAAAFGENLEALDQDFVRTMRRLR